MNILIFFGYKLGTATPSSGYEVNLTERILRGISDLGANLPNVSRTWLLIPLSINA
jgi:hypothetical protein